MGASPDAADHIQVFQIQGFINISFSCRKGANKLAYVNS